MHQAQRGSLLPNRNNYASSSFIEGLKLPLHIIIIENKR